MRGIVFTEFLELVERDHGAAVADRIIEASLLESRGAYTSVGTYDRRELVRLVHSLADLTGEDVPQILRGLGRALFEPLATSYAGFVRDLDHPLDVLEHLEARIHFEVGRLHADAELPTFESTRHAPERLTLIYRSPHPLPDFAEGLMLGCADHFGVGFDIEREVVEGDGEEGEAIRFELTCVSPTS